MTTVPPSFPFDMPSLLSELDTQADSILTLLQVIKNLHREHKKADSALKSSISIAIQEHEVQLAMCFSIIKLDAQILTDEAITSWLNNSPSNLASNTNNTTLQNLTVKLNSVDDALADLRIHFLNEPS